MSLALDHRKVAHAAQKCVGDTRSTARAQSNLNSRIVINRDAEDRSCTLHNTCQHRSIVVFEVALYAETGPQRRGQKAAAGRSTDKRKRRKLNLNRACRGTLIQHNINLIVLHCRVEILLDNRAQSMNLVNEQHIARTEVCQQTRQVARFVEHRARGHL